MRSPEESVRAWDALTTFIGNHWLKPDLIPLRVALAQYAIHWQMETVPAWSFILGPPGSAKSSMVIRAVKALKDGVYTMDIINKNSFVSGWGKDYGLLPQMIEDANGRKAGVIVFSDFSTFLDMNKDERKFIQSQLRVIYDGSCGKTLGNQKMDGQPAWEGKVTLIAACTTALESHWNLARDLGERFIYCRMEDKVTSDIMSITYQSMQQMNNGNPRIMQSFDELVRKFVDPDGLIFRVYVDGIPTSGLPELAYLISHARGKVLREGNTVVDVSEIEYPTRLVQELTAIAMGNARLMRRTETAPQDFKLAARVGFNSIPRARLILLQDLWNRPTQGYCESAYQLAFSHSSYKSLQRTIEDLQALKFIETFGDPMMVKLTSNGFEMMRAARFGM